eukprot:m.89915 g.89915  ORF g.89915 m.89915 type:complete len:66 (+) comp14870_c0_seq1:446-643(+)
MALPVDQTLFITIYHLLSSLVILHSSLGLSLDTSHLLPTHLARNQDSQKAQAREHYPVTRLLCSQ